MASTKFDLACEEIKKFVEKLKDDEKLEVYGLFKQGTIGENTTPKPGFITKFINYMIGMLSFKDKAKWEAWTSRKGMTADDAKAKYVETVKALAIKNG